MNTSTAGRVVAVTPSDTNYITAIGWTPDYGNDQTATTASLAGDTLTLASNGLANGDILLFSSVGTITGISVNIPYFVVGVSGNDFQVSLTYGGTAANLAGATTTLPTWRKQQDFQSAVQKVGFINVTTSGTYKVLPEDHFDTNTTTVAPMGAQDVYIAAGVPFPVRVKKVFSTGSASATGIVLLTDL
jgi:hypothetical protein